MSSKDSSSSSFVLGSRVGSFFFFLVLTFCRKGSELVALGVPTPSQSSSASLGLGMRVPLPFGLQQPTPYQDDGVVESLAPPLPCSHEEYPLEKEWAIGSFRSRSKQQLLHLHQSCPHDLSPKLHQDVDDLWCRQLTLHLHLVVKTTSLVHYFARISSEILDPV